MPHNKNLIENERQHASMDQTKKQTTFLYKIRDLQ